MKQKKIKSKFKLNPRSLTFIALGLAIAGLIYFFKNQFVVAWVNGQPISRLTYTRELQKLAKNQALEGLLTKRLITDEAAKNKVTVSNDEIDQAVKDIEEKAKAQGTSLDELLTAQGVEIESVREEIKLQKMLEKLVGEITVDDQQVAEYYETNQEVLFEGQKLEEVKDEIASQLKQQNLIQKMQELISRLQTEAKIVKWL